MSAPESSPETSESTSHEPLLLEAAPEGSDDVQKLDVQSEKPLKFDALGPMVVNSDGVRLHLLNVSLITLDAHLST